MSSHYIHSTTNRKVVKVVIGILGALYLAALAACIGYICFFTQNRYRSVASFKITNPSGSGMDFEGFQIPFSGIGDNIGLDSQVVIGYINSSDLLLEIESKYGLRDHYASPARDFVFRLEDDAPLEERLKYYRKRIYSHYDAETGLLMLTVDTFDPKLSMEIAGFILRKSEMFVNVMNQNVADQQVGFVKAELDRAEGALRDANIEMTKLQNKYQIISPQDIIGAKLSAINDLQKEKMREETDLATILRDAPESPRIEILRSRIRSLNERVDVEQAVISGPESDRFNQILLQFRDAQIKIDFTTRMRGAAEALMEKTRVQAIAKSKFFSLIQNPYLPEDIAEPRRWYWSLTFLFVGILVFFGLRALARSTFDRV